jgi:CheY-like chemotaxis protein
VAAPIPAALRRPLPVKFITGADKEATRQATLEAGCVADLGKPFPSGALIEAIEKIS